MFLRVPMEISSFSAIYPHSDSQTKTCFESFVSYRAQDCPRNGLYNLHVSPHQSNWTSQNPISLSVPPLYQASGCCLPTSTLWAQIPFTSLLLIRWSQRHHIRLQDSRSILSMRKMAACEDRARCAYTVKFFDLCLAACRPSHQSCLTMLRIVAKRRYVNSTWLSAIPDPMSSGGARSAARASGLVCDLPLAGHPTSHHEVICRLDRL
ncbi:hypothetical protein C8J57DRAFT_423263 [Mycena rebaudengoi]|nr:hypothetical protein C8J57DRAFT_423263 [Mycena rebaudengoi]